MLFIAGGQRVLELVTALQNLENQVQVVAAVTLVQIFHILQNGGGDALEACGTVGGQNLALDIIAQRLLPREQVTHTFQRLCFHDGSPYIYTCNNHIAPAAFCQSKPGILD